MEAREARHPGSEILVERDEGGERCAGCWITQPQPVIARGIGDDDMATVGARLVEEQRAERMRIDALRALKPLRRGIENDGDGGQFGPPDRLFVEFIRRSGERTTPIAGRTPPRRFPWRRRRARCVPASARAPLDKCDCASGTLRRVRRDQALGTCPSCALRAAASASAWHSPGRIPRDLEGRTLIAAVVLEKRQDRAVRCAIRTG